MIKKTIYTKGAVLNKPWKELYPTVYKYLGFIPDEQEHITEWLFNHYSMTNNIVIYEIEGKLSLVGIFPKDKKVAYFGYWETVEDLDINQEVFSLFEEEARLKGFKTVVGPLHFNTYHRYRLRLGPIPSWKMFDREPVNPEYYPRLLEKCGYHVSQIFESHCLAHDVIEQMFQIASSFNKGNYPENISILPLSTRLWLDYEQQLYDLTTSIFSNNSNYKGVLPEEFKLLYNEAYAAGLCPHSSSLLIDHQKNQLAALSLCMPIYAHLKSSSGNYEIDIKNITNPTLLAKTVGTHPDYRGQNLMNAMGMYGTSGFLKRYNKVIFCLMKVDNASLNFTQHLEKETTRYGLFEKSIA